MEQEMFGGNVNISYFTENKDMWQKLFDLAILNLTFQSWLIL